MRIAEETCGQSYVSARSLAIASAESLRASPCLPVRTAVHALVLNEGRGTLSAEQRGYGNVGFAVSPGAAGPSLSAPPSPMLA